MKTKDTVSINLRGKFAFRAQEYLSYNNFDATVDKDIIDYTLIAKFSNRHHAAFLYELLGNLLINFYNTKYDKYEEFYYAVSEIYSKFTGRDDGELIAHQIEFLVDEMEGEL